MVAEVEDAKKRLGSRISNHIFRCRGCGKLISIPNRDIYYIGGYDQFSILDRYGKFHICEINLDSRKINCAPILDLIGIECY